MTKISEHISYDEATNSPTALRLGIRNEPNDEQLTNMMAVAEICFEPLRKWYGKPIRITSFFRHPDLNKAIGGATNSQHCNGQAMDITVNDRKENLKLFNWLKANALYDQVIAEDLNEDGCSWVHISFNRIVNRKQALIMEVINNKQVYRVCQ